MRVILIMVYSVDGKITKWRDGDSYEWTSKEDKVHFQSALRKSNLIVMGSRTFEIAKPKAKKRVLRIVMTRNPRKYASLSVAGQLEFTNESPRELVDQLERKGYKELLLVGGSEINTSFFQQGLVDELWLTIEPRIFGRGKMIVEQEHMEIQLKLDTVKKLNAQGTLLLRYLVVKKP